MLRLPLCTIAGIKANEIENNFVCLMLHTKDEPTKRDVSKHRLKLVLARKFRNRYQEILYTLIQSHMYTHVHMNTERCQRFI